MYNYDRTYPYYNYNNTPMKNSVNMSEYTNQYENYNNQFDYDTNYYLSQSLNGNTVYELQDYGSQPFVINIEDATVQNNYFRTTLWTGDHLQVALMSIDVGEEIGLELHSTEDQFLRIEEGEGLVLMGDTQDNLDYQMEVYDDDAVFVPAGKWHNLINTGDIPLKLYSIYAPPEHPKGTVHETKAIADAAEEHHDN